MTDRRSASQAAMTPERWAQLEPLVDAALDLSPEQRREYVEQVSTGDATLGAELESLVNRSERGESADALLDSAAAARSRLLLEESASTISSRDLQANLQASLGSAYLLERELGGGGMSRVFIADEPGLGRKVVIKVLTPELTAGLSAERFEREIRLAASLQQANIVPLLAAGSAAGFPYYTMPLVDGRSLRERLARDGRLPVGEAVNVLRDIARALAYAHDRGVVHRDIKPGNVLLSGMTAVVTDFGIAKALGAASDQGALGPTLTQTGTGIGTPAYMSPEQATGDPATDQRTDIYAFGCVAYEMFTGKPPFHGRATHQVIAAHFQEKPLPVTDERADAPPAIAALIAQCLEKNPARRPQNAGELLLALDASATSQPGIVAPRRTPIVAVAAAALGVIGLAAATLFVVQRTRTPAEPVAFGVLPFVNVARDTSLDYRAHGISDEILTAMGRVPGIQITARSAAWAYKDQRAVDANAVERALGLRFLVIGTLEETDGKLIVSAQLNDSITHGELWAGRFERDPKALGSVSDDIARTITDTLRARFGSRFGKGRTAPGAGTTNAAALDLYLLGQEFLKHRGAGIAQGVDAFEQAIKLDPNFARAWAALARGLQFYPYFNGTPPGDVRARVLDAATRALSLDSTLADAHAALGAVYSNDGQRQKAGAEIEHALALEPDNFEARGGYARYLTSEGRVDAALAQFAEARKLERISATNSAWTSYLYYLNGQTDLALAEAARAFQLDSTQLAVTNWGALINVETGHPDMARRVAALIPSPRTISMAPYVYARLGDTATAWRLVRAMEMSNPRPWFVEAERGSVLFAMGDTAGAFTALERSQAASGGIWTTVLNVFDPMFDPLRSSPRFVALVRNAGFDVARATSPRGGRPH